MIQAFCWSLKKRKQNIHIYDFHDVFRFFMLFFYLISLHFNLWFQAMLPTESIRKFLWVILYPRYFLTGVNIKLWVWKDILFPGNEIVTRSLAGVRWTCECRVNYILRSHLQSQFFSSYRFCGLDLAVNYIRTQKEIVFKKGSVKADLGLTAVYCF